MNNDEYKEALAPKLAELQALREKAKDVARGLIGNNIFQEDLFFASALDRGIDLLDGMVYALEKRNLTCSGILVRSLIDNCLRIYAAYIADEKDAFISGILKGKKVSDFKDDCGKKMKDVNLREKLKSLDCQISDVYERASGYVHLSDKAFHKSVHSEGDSGFSISIGLPLREGANPVLLECAEAFIHYTILQYELLQPVVVSKEQADTKLCQ